MNQRNQMMQRSQENQRYQSNQGNQINLLNYDSNIAKFLLDPCEYIFISLETIRETYFNLKMVDEFFIVTSVKHISV